MTTASTSGSRLPAERVDHIEEEEVEEEQQQEEQLILAVSVRDVAKSYDLWSPWSTPKQVLHDVTMTIQRGTICGLLGPSGCGKTTLLNCIVGQARVNRGEILLFGHPTGSKASGVPGRRIGFMPQDISLSFDLKIGETLNLYGTLLHMTAVEIKAKSEFLTALLELPPLDRFIDSLSGGQQRRVSLAIALIHDPELVILDEPTVGVDPIVRKRIWDHLFELTLSKKQTIIITTHYIEEAIKAHTVQMLYDGTIICAGPPHDVIRKNNCLSLEAVFLKVCLKLVRQTKKTDGAGEREHATPLLDSADVKSVPSCSGHRSGAMELSGIKHDDNDEDDGDDGADEVVVVTAKSDQAGALRELSFFDKVQMSFRLPTFHRVRALTMCNFKKSYRHAGHFIVHVIIPFIILIVFNLAFGGFPKKIPIGVVNDDTEELGATLLSHVNAENVVLKYYTNYAEGRRAVEVGDTWGILYVQENFSDSIYRRVMYGTTVSDTALDGSTIRLAMDVTCHPITMVVLDALHDAFIKFGRNMLEGTGIDPGIVSSPLNFSYDIFERDHRGLMGFASPGIIMCGIYFLAMANCILSLLSDKSSGQFFRNIVAGVTELELVLGYLGAFSVGIFIQAVTYIVVAFWVLGIYCAGPIYSVFLLVFLHGLCGIAFGLCISTFCTSEFTAIMLGFGSFLPSVCLSGVVWPIESIPNVMQGICRLLPQSYVVDGLRGVMKRGWQVHHPVVAYGYAANLVWMMIFLLVSSVLLRIK